MATSGGDVSSGLSRLNLKATAQSSAPKSRKGRAKDKVADSWDDEDVSSESEGDLRPSTAGNNMGSNDGTAAPPPTPTSAAHPISRPFAPMSAMDQFDGHDDRSSRRPEKTDAVARRMIAGALGVKAPKLTEEQKAYDEAMKTKERRRREEEKAAEKKRTDEAEKAKAAMWDD